MSVCVPYASYAHKRQAYLAQTLPAVRAAALAGVEAVRRHVKPGWSIKQLHEWARAGLYVGEDGPIDCVRDVALTIERGGDCEDWAAVLLAGAIVLDVPARIVTAGDDRDPHRHVYVEFFDPASGWVPSNPKGSQYGQSLGESPMFGRYDRHAGTVQGSGCDCLSGSGADEDPLIKSNADAAKWLTPEQNRKYLESYGNINSPARIQIAQALLHGYHGLRRSQMLARIGVSIQAKAAAITGPISQSVQQAAQDYTQYLNQVKSLRDVNRVMASYWADEMLQPGASLNERRAALRQLAIANGAKTSASDAQCAAVAAFVTSEQATALGVVLDDWLADVQQYPSSEIPQRLARLGVTVPQGSGKKSTFQSGFEQLARDVSKFFRDTARAIGEGLKKIAAVVFDATEVPILGDFILKPLGFHLQATLLDQLGNMFVAGKVSAFDYRAVGYSTAETLVAAGRALVTASPFLPPPWNLLAAAVGALSMAAGGVLHDVLADSEGGKQLGESAPVAVTVDQYGREVDADGLPVDPYQRQLEIERRQREAAQQGQPDPDRQQAGEWRQGGNGMWYGWHHWNTQHWYWSALQTDPAGNVVAAWAYTQQGWVRL